MLQGLKKMKLTLNPMSSQPVDLTWLVQSFKSVHRTRHVPALSCPFMMENCCRQHFLSMRINTYKNARGES